MHQYPWAPSSIDVSTIITAAFRALRCKRNLRDAPTNGNSAYQGSNFDSEVPAAPTKSGKFAGRHHHASADLTYVRAARMI